MGKKEKMVTIDLDEYYRLRHSAEINARIFEDIKNFEARQVKFERQLIMMQREIDRMRGHNEKSEAEA